MPLQATERVPAVVMFSTCDMQGARSDELQRMIRSVEAVRQKPHQPAIILHLLLQRAAEVPGFIPDWVCVQTIPGRVSLSKARNMLIARALQDGLDDQAVVTFPDDDAWYPAGVLEHILSRFAAEPMLDLWFCRYGLVPALDPAVAERAATLQTVLSYASSNTIVIRGQLLKQLGSFDENLGVGTAAGGGEDTEFASRAYHGARHTRFLDVKAIGHREIDRRIKVRYYAGSLQAIAQNRRLSREAAVALARKLLVGCAYVSRRQMKARELVSVVRTAWRAQPL